MRVAFNATPLLTTLTGIGQYTLQLANALAARPDTDPDFFYSVRWDKRVHTDFMPPVAGRMAPYVRRIPGAYRLRRFVQEMNFRSHAMRCEIYHEPNFLPLPIDRPTVITVHDLSFIRYREMHPKERIEAMDTFFEPGLKRAQRILTDSDFTRRELLEVFDDIDPAIVQTVPLGVEALFHPRGAEDTRETLMRHGLAHGQYLLAVGTLEPRKNLKTALLAYSRLPAELRRRFPLVIAGMKGWHTSALDLQMQPLIDAGEIRLLGYVSRDDLAAVVAGARLLVYPSVYEGFGLPPLEAMACGVPTIVANVSSLPEVVGDTGLTIDDPHDVEALTLALERLASDDVLHAELGAQALARSAEFTWERCVDRTVDAYRDVLRANR
jgi:glycosyltransferase involved in cell wall biosynthesis